MKEKLVAESPAGLREHIASQGEEFRKGAVRLFKLHTSEQSSRPTDTTDKKAKESPSQQTSTTKQKINNKISADLNSSKQSPTRIKLLQSTPPKILEPSTNLEDKSGRNIDSNKSVAKAATIFKSLKAKQPADKSPGPKSEISQDSVLDRIAQTEPIKLQKITVQEEKFETQAKPDLKKSELIRTRAKKLPYSLYKIPRGGRKPEPPTTKVEHEVIVHEDEEVSEDQAVGKPDVDDTKEISGRRIVKLSRKNKIQAKGRSNVFMFLYTSLKIAHDRNIGLRLPHPRKSLKGRRKKSFFFLLDCPQRGGGLRVVH